MMYTKGGTLVRHTPAVYTPQTKMIYTDAFDVKRLYIRFCLRAISPVKCKLPKVKAVQPARYLIISLSL